MIYLISRAWQNTLNNHAGITYLCNELAKMDMLSFQSIVIPSFGLGKSVNPVVDKCKAICLNYKRKRFYGKILEKLFCEMKDGDCVFLMEYLDGSNIQNVAMRIKREKPLVRLFAMAHLVPEKITKLYPKDEELNTQIQCIDKLFTLGHSLTNYFISRNVDRSKLVTTFHYVDSYYYNSNIENHNEMKVIVMGNQMRNVHLLKEIVNKCPLVKFVICQGMNDFTSLFRENENVELIPFVEEYELRKLMQNSDVSLNVMNDTIGSNVIVTSLAMGLAMICSDVGSIRDYCDNTNCLFCNNDVEDFVRAIITLSNDKKLLSSMRNAALESAKTLSICRFKQELLCNLK